MITLSTPSRGEWLESGRRIARVAIIINESFKIDFYDLRENDMNGRLRLQRTREESFRFNSSPQTRRIPLRRDENFFSRGEKKFVSATKKANLRF